MDNWSLHDDPLTILTATWKSSLGLIIPQCGAVSLCIDCVVMTDRRCLEVSRGV